MRIFITGGAGFIGIHLCKKLLKLDHTITVYDDFSNSSQENFLSKINGKINLITGNILDYPSLEHSMNKHDVVIHLAAKISVSDSVKNPESTFDVNVNGTTNVLESCAKNNVSKIIVTSTAAVYQNVSEQTILDESSDVGPSSPYGESKLEMEHKIISFTSKNDINAVILRLFNVYGIGQSLEYAGVITKFLDDIESNNDLTIFGDGKQTRDFVYIDDVVDAIIFSINTPNFGIYNIASGDSTSIINLAHILIKQSSKNLKLQFNSSRQGEIKFSTASILKAKKYLNFEPNFEISQGLAKLCNENFLDS
jgi:UDP-glucose 4-epimerase